MEGVEDPQTLDDKPHWENDRRGLSQTRGFTKERSIVGRTSQSVFDHCRRHEFQYSIWFFYSKDYAKTGPICVGRDSS